MILARLAEEWEKSEGKIRMILHKSFAANEKGSDSRVRKYVTPTDYKIHPDGSVEFYTSVEMVDPHRKVPIKIREAHSGLNLNGVNLTSLEGCPRTVGGMFRIDGNPNLKSLLHCPTFCGSINALRCGLTTVEHGPTTVQRDYNIAGNRLTTLKHLPDGFENLMLTYYDDLPLLKIPTIKGLKNVIWLDERGYNTNFPDRQVEDLIDDMVGAGRPGAIELQRALMNWGLEKNARY